MRRAARIDANQQAIVSALRAVGASVQSLAMVGNGCPDLLAYCRGEYFLIECKDGSKPPSARRLTPDQIEWRKSWRGPVATVLSPEDALKVIGAMT